FLSGLHDLPERDATHCQLQGSVFALLAKHECIENRERPAQPSLDFLRQQPACLRIEVAQARKVRRGSEGAQRVAHLVRELTYQRAAAFGPGFGGIQHMSLCGGVRHLATGTLGVAISTRGASLAKVPVYVGKSLQAPTSLCPPPSSFCQVQPIAVVHCP